MIGDYNTTETVHLPFNTFSSNDPSASVTITNLAAGDIHIHKDGAVTQRSSSAGVTISVDFDGITGNHMAHIDLSDNTDAGFYATGSTFQVRVEGTTVDAGTINAWIGTFSIDRTLRPTVAGRTLDITATGAAGIDWANVEGQGTTVDLSATSIDLCDDVTTVATTTTNTDMITGFATEAKQDIIDTNVDSVLVDTGTTLPAQLDSMSGATFNTSTDSLEAIRNRGDVAWTTGAGGSSPTVEEIRTEMDDNSTQLAAIVLDTGTTLPNQITALNDFDHTSDTVITDATSRTASQADVSDIPTVAEFNARTIPSADYVVVGDTIARVTLVDTVTTNTDMRGTDSANTVVPDVAGTAAGLHITTDGKIDTVDSIVDSILSLLDDPRSEPGQGAPPVNGDAMTKLDYLYKMMRNKKEQTSTEFSLYNDAGTVVDQKATVSDDLTTATVGEIVTGA